MSDKLVETIIGDKEKIEEYRKQRIEKGYDDNDVYDIDTWFFRILPKMIKELREQTAGYPAYFDDDYISEHHLDIDNISDEDNKAMSEAGFKKWTNILEEMEKAFLESSDFTCSYKNKYEKEYFEYAFSSGNAFSKDSELYKLYQSEEDKIIAYQKENRQKALELFSKYLGYLYVC